MAPILAVAILATLGQEAGAVADVLATLRPGHPRLILLDEDLPRLRATIAQDALAGRWCAGLRERAEALLSEPPTEFRIIGPRLLHASRSVVDRVYTLGFLYRLDGDERYGRRAVEELVAAAAWETWNPLHYLDTAELNHAFGIGYDWLQPLLGEHRETVKQALMEKGLAAALFNYERNAWWSRCNHNWNQVCNCGNLIGALAVADEEPEIARRIVASAVALLPNAMREYGPDGGWAEGPGYWHYATSYNVYGLAALETALGTDFGLSGIEGFDRAGDFRLHFVGPSGRCFNYADAGEGVGSAPEMFWLARRFDAPRWAWQERQLGNGSAPDLIWFDGRGGSPEAERVPLDAVFLGVDVVFLRGSWTDPNATWVAFKGGDNQANHSHLDLGSFVLDSQGERWIRELGVDDYNLPGYFGAQRWTYYRLATIGQNTLMVGGEDQEPSARAPLTAFSSTPGLAYGVADLTAAYPRARRVWRGVGLLDRRDVLMVDEVEASEPSEVLWHAHTSAVVEVRGPEAVLELAGKRLYARVLSPEGAWFEARSARRDPPENPNEGITRLTVVLPEEVSSLRLAVLFSPEAGAAPPDVPSLSDWVQSAPVER